MRASTRCSFGAGRLGAGRVAPAGLVAIGRDLTGQGHRVGLDLADPALVGREQVDLAGLGDQEVGDQAVVDRADRVVAAAHSAAPAPVGLADRVALVGLALQVAAGLADRAGRTRALEAARKSIVRDLV